MKNFQLIFLIFITSLSGCASVHQTFISNNIETKDGTNIQKSKVYSGVKLDGSTVKNCFSSGGYAIIICPIALLAVIDLPFSLVADTIFLPYTIPHRVITNQDNKEKLDEAANERLLVFNFVRNNEEIIRETGGIKAIPQAEYLRLQPHGAPKKYDVSVTGYNGKVIYAIIGVSISQGDVKFNLECTTHLVWAARDLRKGVCEQ